MSMIHTDSIVSSVSEKVLLVEQLEYFYLTTAMFRYDSFYKYIRVVSDQVMSCTKAVVLG